MKPSLLYRFLKIYTSIGLWFYFRQWQIAGKENIPTKGPLIYIANHQNAFMDAILMTCSASRNPYYLTRANVFKKTWAAKLLALLHLKPIYRFRDGFGTLKKNEVIMQDCIDLMKQGEVILLFPEGSHNEPWSLREFQKGFARMAQMYWQQTNDASLKIIPIGIHYIQHHSFNTRVLLNIGEPIVVAELTSNTRTDRENLEAIVKYGEAALKQLALDIKPNDEYVERQKYLIDNRKYKSTMRDQLQSDRDTVAAFPAKNIESVASNGLFNVIMFPFKLYMYATHGLLYFWLSEFIKQKIKDPQFISSVKFSMAIFITPVYYLLLSLLFYVITKNGLFSLLFLISLPISLLLATKTQRH